MFFSSQIWVTIAAEDLELLVEFYRQLFAQSPSLYYPHSYAEFQLPQLRLGIFRPQKEHLAEFSPPGRGSFSLCLEVPDLEQAIEVLTNWGYPPPGPILNADHGREIYGYDPLGHRLILHQTHRK